MSRKAKLEQMLATQPDDAFLHYALAMEFMKEANFGLATGEFDRVLAIDPGYLGAYSQKAQAQINQHCVGDAKATLQQGIEAAQRKQDTHAAEEMVRMLDSLGPIPQ